VKGVSKSITGSQFKKIVRKLQVNPLGHLAQAND
jgi:hypothetical protein